MTTPLQARRDARIKEVFLLYEKCFLLSVDRYVHFAQLFQQDFIRG